MNKSNFPLAVPVPIRIMPNLNTPDDVARLLRGRLMDAEFEAVMRYIRTIAPAGPKKAAVDLGEPEVRVGRS